MGIGDLVEPSQREVEFRTVPVSRRSLGHAAIVARPSDGAPVVLPATAAAVLEAASDWSASDAIDCVLAARFPTVDADDRQRTLGELLRSLLDEGLLERR